MTVLTCSNMRTISSPPLPEQTNLWNEFVRDVREAVDSNDGSILVKGLPVTPEDETLVALGRALGPLSLAGAHSVDKRYAYNVEVRSETGIPDELGLLIYSSTDWDFPCHTDEYRIEAPADLVAMHCVRPDECGAGRTILYHLRDLLMILTPPQIDVLRRNDFPSQFGSTSIIWDSEGGTCIRYNRREVDRFADLNSQPLSSNQRSVLDRLDSILRDEAFRSEFLLESNDCVLLNNRTILHGRTKLTTGSHRLLKRIRLHAGPPLHGVGGY